MRVCWKVPWPELCEAGLLEVLPRPAVKAESAASAASREAADGGLCGG